MARTGVSKSGKKDYSVLGWLLEEEQPAMRYLTLTELFERKQSDSDVIEAKNAIPKTGWASEILGKQLPNGTWAREDRLYEPKYLSTNWMLLILSDLGITKKDPRIAKSCELWIEKFAKSDGGFAADGSKRSHLCTAGNTARALVKFGYEDDPRVKSAIEWFVQNQAKLGGWSCFGSGRNLDSWEPLSAFAVYPKSKWSKEMKEAVEKGAEFYLERELHVQGDHYEPWYRFHYPIHYYYDLLVGLDFMTALGYAQDKRMEHAISLLKKKRGRDGRWKLDAVHPDVEGGMARFFKEHPKQAPTSFALESVGNPSKMITFTALKVLKRLGEDIN